jgi:hypothetical protein
MSRVAYRYQLWKSSRSRLGADPECIVDGDHIWLDLEDEDATIGQIVNVAIERGARDTTVGQYTVVVFDAVTGECVTTLPLADLLAARGAQPELPAPDGGARALRHVSTGTLIRELARRLTYR